MFSLRTTPFLEQGDLTLRNGRIALLCNQAAWHPDRGAYLFDLMAERGNLAKLFLTSHSFYGPFGENPATPEIPTVEVESELPIGELDGMDALVIELQDIGSRYSRFTNLLRTLFAQLKEAGSELPIYIIDRTVPSGRQIEGPMGGSGIPPRHGLTFGEMANLFYSEMNARFPVHIISAGAEAVNKELMPWSIPPFSDFCGLFTSHFYSGQCLWRGTNVSYGHGTTRPFEQFGAPFMEPLLDYNRRHGFDGWNDPAGPISSDEVMLRPTRFVPGYGIWAGEVCTGFQLLFIPGKTYHAYNHALRIIRFVREECPEMRFDGIEKYIDDPRIMEFLEGGAGWDETREYIKGEEQKWLRKSKKYLLYDEAPWRVK